MVLAGVINALKKTDIPIKDQRAVFFGAGSAGVGVAKQIVEYFMKEGLTEDEVCIISPSILWLSSPQT